MYAPHTVTVYNVSENLDTLESERNVTVLDGVFLDISKAANVQRSGLENADAATLFIPFSVYAYDPFTGNKKTYVTAKRYAELEDKTNYWTLQVGGESSSVPCFFVKGAIAEDLPYSAIRSRFDFVYDVTSVDTRDFGSEHMQHWQVGGK